MTELSWRVVGAIFTLVGLAGAYAFRSPEIFETKVAFALFALSLVIGVGIIKGNSVR